MLFTHESIIITHDNIIYIRNYYYHSQNSENSTLPHYYYHIGQFYQHTKLVLPLPELGEFDTAASIFIAHEEKVLVPEI
jgi:hypothetical protein